MPTRRGRLPRPAAAPARRTRRADLSAFSPDELETIDGVLNARLEREAAARGTSVATLVREAIDRTFPPRHDRRSSAAAAILGAEPMEVPDVEDLVAELDGPRGRHE